MKAKAIFAGKWMAVKIWEAKWYILCVALGGFLF